MGELSSASRSRQAAEKEEEKRRSAEEEEGGRDLPRLKPERAERAVRLAGRGPTALQ